MFFEFLILKQLFFWGVHCGIAGTLIDRHPMYSDLLALPKNLANEEKFWRFMENHDSSDLLILIASISCQAPRSYPAVLKHVQIHIRGAIQYTNGLLSKLKLPLWEENEHGKYDLAVLSYDTVKSLWLNFLTTLISCSMRGAGRAFIDETKMFLRSIFTDTSVKMAAWLAKVIDETHSGFKTAVRTYMSNFSDEFQIHRFGLVQPYNIGLWTASIYRDFKAAGAIFDKIPKKMYNAHTFAMIVQCYRHQKQDPERLGNSFISRMMELGYLIAKDIVDGISTAGAIESGRPLDWIEERFLVNFQLKEILCLAAKEAQRAAGSLKTQDKAELQNAIDQMFYLTYACCLNGYSVDEKELEVCILNLINSYLVLGAQSNDRAVIIAQFYLKDARPNNFKAILVLLAKLGENHLFARHLCLLWRQHPYQLYLRFLHESFTFPLMKALEAEGHYKDAAEYFILVISPRNGMAHLLINDEKMWAIFFRCCRHLLLDESATINARSAELGSTTSDYFQRAINCLWRSRKLSDLGLLSCLIRELCKEELFDYSSVLLGKIHEEFCSYGSRNLNKAMNPNGLEALISAIEHVMNIVQAQSNVPIFSSTENGKAFQRNSGAVLNILMNRKADGEKKIIKSNT